MSNSPRAAITALILALGLTAQAAQQPNVLLLSVDDLKPTIGAYGDTVAITPSMNQLADSGTVMLKNYCQQAVCAPSRMSMFTGLRPDSTKVWDLRTHLLDVAPDAVTMQELFKNNGYTTAGSGKVMHGATNEHPKSWSVPFTSKKNLPFAEGYPVPAHDNSLYQGDKEHAAFKAMNESGVTHWKERMTWMAEKGAQPATENIDVPDDAYVDGALASWAITQLEDYAQSKEPFFLTVGFTKPHLPFVAPKKYWDLYDRDQIELAEFREHATNTPDFVYHKYGELRSYSDISRDFNEPIDDKKARELIHGYYACVSFIDAQIGRVLAKLEELGLAENTIVVLWGDHGWHLGDHGMWCKHSNFEQATRSPLIIHAPGFKPGRTESLTEFVDIFPTLVQLANLEDPYPLEGVSLVPLLENPDATIKDYAISQYTRSNGRMGYSLRNDRYRYTVWMGADWRTTMPYDPSLVKYTELYDYDTDPLEKANQANNPEYAQAVAELNAMMLDYFKTYEQQPIPTAEDLVAGVKPADGSEFIDLETVNTVMLPTRFAAVESDGDGLIINFENSPKWPSVDFMASDEAPWNLSEYQAIELSLTNMGSAQLNTTAYVANSGDTNATKKRSGNRIFIPAGATEVLRIQLDSSEYPFDPSRLNSLRIFASKLNTTAKLRVNSIQAVGSGNAPMATTSKVVSSKATPKAKPAPTTTSSPVAGAATPGTGDELLNLSKVTATDVHMRFAQIAPGLNGTLMLDFELSSKWPSVHFSPQGTSIWNLSGKQSVQVSLTNEGNAVVKTLCFLANADDSHSNKKRSAVVINLAPGATQTAAIPIAGADASFDPAQVAGLRISVGMHKAPVKIKLNSIKVL